MTHRGFLSARPPLVAGGVEPPTGFLPFEGFGANADGGGNNPNIFTVTNANNSGVGSLRDAAAQAENNSPAAIHFNLPDGAWIETETPINFEGDNITIDGSTSPGRFGIRVRNQWNTTYPMSIRGDNYVIRGLRVHRGLQQVSPNSNGKAFLLLGARNIYIVNCSFAWAEDEIVTFFTGRRNCTMDYCMIYEPMINGHQPKADGEDWDDRGFMTLVSNSGDSTTTARVTFTRCVFAHGTTGRHPIRIRDNETEMINLIAYNGDGQGLHEGEWNAFNPPNIHSNYEGSLTINGPDSNESAAPLRSRGNDTFVYVNDIAMQRKNGTITTNVNNIINPRDQVQNTQFDFNPAVPVTRIAATALWPHLKDRVGAFDAQGRRSHSDERIAAQIHDVLAVAYGGLGNPLPAGSQQIDTPVEGDGNQNPSARPQYAYESPDTWTTALTG